MLSFWPERDGEACLCAEDCRFHSSLGLVRKFPSAFASFTIQMFCSILYYFHEPLFLHLESRLWLIPLLTFLLLLLTPHYPLIFLQLQITLGCLESLLRIRFRPRLRDRMSIAVLNFVCRFWYRRRDPDRRANILL